MHAVAYVEELLGWVDDGPTPASIDGRSQGERHTPAAGVAAARILVADDNADMRDYVRSLLSQHYQVEAVADGAAALRAARERAPDLVLTDVMMPNLDGFELLRELRADDRLKTVPVIVLSARAGEEARVEGVTAGADDYLIKPFSANELLARVASRLQLSQLQTMARDVVAKSEARYRSIFQTASVSIWEEDFSAVKAAIDELKESGVSDYREYFEQHPEFVRHAIDQVRILDVNDATLRMFHANDKEELLQSLAAVFEPESQAVFVEELVALAQGQPNFEAETVARTLRGDRIDVLFSVAFARGDTGEYSALVTTVDITERKRAEQALRADARVLETLNRVGRTLAGEMNLERIMQAVTDAATEVSGAEFGAFFRNVHTDAGESHLLYTISGASREAFEEFGMHRNPALFAATFAGEGVVRLHDVTADPRYGQLPQFGLPSGQLAVRSYLAVPVTSRSGEVIGGLFLGHPDPGVFTSRSERLVSGIATQTGVAIDNARLYEQSLQLIGKLQDSDRLKDEFLATLSHELRNPLAPLRNSLHLLRLAGGESGSAVPIHDMMERQVNHLVRLVDDLLEMSRISRGTFELRREKVELSAVVNNAIETADPLVRAAGHRLIVSMPNEPLYVDGDPVRLAQILANLLNNAAKYTEAGGEITVALRSAGSMAELLVRDNGSGISSEALPHIFEMFSRGDRSSGRDQTGLGIGLALARRLAEMHGGSVNARSEGLGKGSDFIVRLPLAPDQGIRPMASHRIAVIPRKRILVVDDNRDAAESMRMLLEFLGADVHVAFDGTSALEAFASYEPALVLLDIGMPEMDGYEVARRMRAAFPELKATIVALTGWGQEDDRRKARDAGFDRHLIKPADVGALQALLGSLEEPVRR
jgi:PAS domain S-box-containing protein